MIVCEGRKARCSADKDMLCCTIKAQLGLPAASVEYVTYDRDWVHRAVERSAFHMNRSSRLCWIAQNIVRSRVLPKHALGHGHVTYECAQSQDKVSFIGLLKS